eukprot:5907248-Pleurochrysis_carterae.AAC.1
MDPVSKHVKDPRRIIGIDKIPQMLDNNGQGPQPRIRPWSIISGLQLSRRTGVLICGQQCSRRLANGGSLLPGVPHKLREMIRRAHASA